MSSPLCAKLNYLCRKIFVMWSVDGFFEDILKYNFCFLIVMERREATDTARLAKLGLVYLETFVNIIRKEKYFIF